MGGNAGGIATQKQLVAVVNFGSQSVSIFGQDGDGFAVRQVVSTVSPPVSVAFGHDHLYVLGTTTPAGSDTPFGVVTRGDNGYVTIAHSDDISLIKHGQLIAITAIGSGFPSGPGQQAPCWITLVGPYLFTSNSPSHSISRLVATGRNIVLEAPVAARTTGAPIDIAAVGDLLTVIESDGGGHSHLTQFRIDDDGNLVQTASTAITMRG